MLRLRIVTAPQAAEITPASDATTLTVCWLHANARAYAFLVAVAGHVPDELLEQWEVCYRDAEFMHAVFATPAGTSAGQRGQRAA